MAVIKIVPMPGAVGDKGDEGAPGPQGPQGQTGQTGQNGQDALWNYNGEYNPGAGYAVGDVVTYDGQLWYRKNSNGGNVGDTPSEGLFWDLLAAKGADGQGSSDLLVPTSGTWNLIFNCDNGTLVETGPSDSTYSEYYTIGDLVYFDMQYSFSNVTNYGSGSYLFNLPFTPRNFNSFSNNTLVTGLVVDTTSPDSGSNVIYGSIQTVHPVTLNSDGWVLLKYQDASNQMELSSMTFSDPASLTGVQVNPYSRIRVSGVYRKA
jgi:hypothetical protein